MVEGEYFILLMANCHSSQVMAMPNGVLEVMHGVQC